MKITAPQNSIPCQIPIPNNFSRTMTVLEIPTPLQPHEETVLPESIDYNGHMNVAFYVLAFDHTSDAMLDFLQLTHEYKTKENTTTFVADMNVTYRQEVKEGDLLRLTTRVLDCDEKRIHIWHEMYHATQGYLAATNELLSLHIDLSLRRVSPMAADIAEWVADVCDAHADLPLPEGIGRVIGMKKTGF
jgi:acyl-CoA thioester hydrolase